MMDYNIRHGRTYMYFKGEPLYPFGYGLSYTTFAYSNLRTSAASLNAKGSIDVSVDVKNTGKRAGDEVVQLYVKHIGSARGTPGQGTARLQARARASRARPRPSRSLCRPAAWPIGTPTSKSWVVENDKVQLMVGASSADTKLDRTIDVTQ